MNQVIIDCRCPWCGYISSVICKKADYDAYIAGALAQDAFADMDLRHREILISGMCLECQEQYYGAEDEDDWNVDDAIAEEMDCHCEGTCDLCPLGDECLSSTLLKSE